VDIFAGVILGLRTRRPRALHIIFVTVWTCVVARTALLHLPALNVVVVLFPRQHELVALAEERRGTRGPQPVCVPARHQVGRLPNRGDHLLCRLDRVVRTVVLHRHFEVGVHHAWVQVVARAHVDRARGVQRRHHPVDRGLRALRLRFFHLRWIVRAVVAQLHFGGVRAHAVVRHVLQLLLVVEGLLVLVARHLLLDRWKSQVDIVVTRQTVISVLELPVDHQLQLGELLRLARLPLLLRLLLVLRLSVRFRNFALRQRLVVKTDLAVSLVVNLDFVRGHLGRVLALLRRILTIPTRILLCTFLILVVLADDARALLQNRLGE